MDSHRKSVLEVFVMGILIGVCGVLMWLWDIGYFN